MSSPPNTKSISAKGSNGKKSTALTPAKNPHLIQTQMAAFLNTVHYTSYGPVLDEVNVYFKKRVAEDDDYIRTTKDKLQVFIRNHREIHEVEINKWFDNVRMGLRNMSYGLAAKLTEGTLLAHAPAAGEDGKLSQPTKENIQNGHIMNQAVMDKHDDDINTYLLLQLGQFQDAVKKNMVKAHNKLANAGCEAMKKYDKARVDDEGALLGMFLKLKQAEDMQQDAVKKLSNLIISRKDQELLDAAELISSLEEDVQNCQLNHGSVVTPESNTATNGEVATERGKTSEQDLDGSKGQGRSDPIETGVAQALTNTNAVVTTEEVYEDYDLFPAVIKKRKVLSVIQLDSQKGE